MRHGFVAFLLVIAVLAAGCVSQAPQLPANNPTYGQLQSELLTDFSMVKIGYASADGSAPVIGSPIGYTIVMKSLGGETQNSMPVTIAFYLNGREIHREQYAGWSTWPKNKEIVYVKYVDAVFERSGRNTLGTIIDPDNVIRESDERNNEDGIDINIP